MIFSAWQCSKWPLTLALDRAIFVWPWNKNALAKQRQQTNGNRAVWLVHRTDINARGFRLVKRTLGWKNFMPENFLEINRYFALTSYCNTIGQSNNAFSILGFSLAGKRTGQVWSFHPLADKTNNEPLPKPFFKVIRKSLYGKRGIFSHPGKAKCFLQLSLALAQTDD